MSAVRLPARLALEDGWTALGMAVGAAGTATGECVFNTCLSGYEEVLTDPSYTGQLVVMTYPLIGNYGITIEDGESDGPQVAGFVMREFCGNGVRCEGSSRPSCWRSSRRWPERRRSRRWRGRI
jgi:carbamoyl-phosphate synthase small subunit